MSFDIKKFSKIVITIRNLHQKFMKKGSPMESSAEPISEYTKEENSEPGSENEAEQVSGQDPSDGPSQINDIPITTTKSNSRLNNHLVSHRIDPNNRNTTKSKMKREHFIKGPFTKIAVEKKLKFNDLEGLNANKRGIEKIEEDDIKNFPNLYELELRGNKLTALENLDSCCHLDFIDARDNQISDINISGLRFVQTLLLSNNKLEDLHKLLSKISHLKDLRELDLRGNPVALEVGYKSSIISHFPNLKFLDETEVVQPKKKKGTLMSTILTSTVRGFSESFEKKNKKKGRKAKGPLTEIAIQTNQKCFDLEELVADNIGLEEIIEDDIKQFPNLQILYIPRNKIKTLNNLGHNCRITFIDARDNQISDIDLPKLDFVRELYLSGNVLHDYEKVISKISHMKDLETLDLRGNPLTLEKGYRQSMISHFANLKILDGLEVVHPKKKKGTLGETTRQTMTRDRPRSVLECLLTRPLSAADAIVKMKSDQIRMNQKLKIQKLEEEQTAVARKRKEEFEAASKKLPPLPDAVLEIDNKNKALNTIEKKPEKKRASTRMFIKAPVYQTLEEVPDNLEFAVKLNPNLPNVFTKRVSYRTMFPE
ncbi:hypothetical protein TRFO_28838 [Tritrichomonas foetus]|uniref:Leucine Rich Repeat family protein n=1 Tax=Tritrichomonas foetus TaxID=1144522 RepID=A0A1J4JX26_9EUKA|nr:hypothetical protein TRFO_28838 [Tritrichomonas foetus]|eukprot:OHT03703.1 hypothetical protein TRFO_28838 [Tritrichomonas foetus]